MNLYTDIDPHCCAVLGSRVEDGSLPPGDVMLADVRTLTAKVLRPYRHIHLFAGIGGFALGLVWAGWPASISVATFGFPCQDISVAGKGEGLSGSRSGLFWEARRIVHEHQPDVCIAENVGALSRRGLDVVAGAMGEAGYVVPDAYRVGAWALGAPHVRERWWIVGWRRAFVDACARGRGAVGVIGSRGELDACDSYVLADAAGARDERLSTRRGRSCETACHVDWMREGPLQPDASPLGFGSGCMLGSDGQPHGWRQPPPLDRFVRNERGEWQYAGPPVLVYAGGSGSQEPDAPAVASGSGHVAGRSDPTLDRGWPVPVLPGYQQHEWEYPSLHQRGVGSSVHGLSRRMAYALNKSGVMACGNAVVPQVCAAIARGVIQAVD